MMKPSTKAEKDRGLRPILRVWRGPFGEMRTKGMSDCARFIGIPLQSMNTVLSRHFKPWHPNRVKVMAAYPELLEIKELPAFGEILTVGDVDTKGEKWERKE